MTLHYIILITYLCKYDASRNYRSNAFVKLLDDNQCGYTNGDIDSVTAHDITLMKALIFLRQVWAASVNQSCHVWVMLLWWEEKENTGFQREKLNHDEFLSIPTFIAMIRRM